MTGNRRDWLLFAGWLLAGATYGVALLTALTIGPFILPIPLAGTVVLATRRDTQRGMPGLLSAVSLPLFLLTYVNRHGPGTYCDVSRNGETCTGGLLNPWILLAAGLVLFGAGVALFLRNRRLPVISPAAPWPSRGM
ncbi:hypothetical protein GA0115240_15188 [Streptomyces sp. DvalAA-14]|uniref:hypothetical protein n=1 Tax=unclassified Streptomyces TaxID=2593676 RepID=UPI00081B4CD6|nr:MULTISPECIES: hypothetical protein [unclassified Streptomyces]MYS23316.1 hypothetical protein [Streptomyces sp. SID4948]SCE31442.1 hypothetical protein GA0115240_15188 [Streptomyces sp. DvalAA-14]